VDGKNSKLEPGVPQDVREHLIERLLERRPHPQGREAGGPAGRRQLPKLIVNETLASL
jgi:hypothetical protein